MHVRPSPNKWALASNGANAGKVGAFGIAQQSFGEAENGPNNGLDFKSASGRFLFLNTDRSSSRPRCGHLSRRTLAFSIDVI